MNRHTLNEIAPRVYWLSPDSSTDRPVLGVIAGERGSLVVDAGASPAHAADLLAAIEARGLPAPIYLALTHWHWDHVFGIAAFPVPTIASDETRRIVTAMADLDWSDAALDARVAAGTEIAFCRDMIKAELPDRSGLTIRPPDIGFSDELTVDLGGATARAVHVGGDHASDASVVFAPEARVVFLGDCLAPDIYHTPRRSTTAKLFPMLDRLLALDADWYLAGHDPAPVSRAELEAEALLLGTIGKLVDRIGPDRAAVLAALPEALGGPADADQIEIADEFLAGLG